MHKLNASIQVQVFFYLKKYWVYTQKEEKWRYRVMQPSGSRGLRSYPLLNIYLEDLKVFSHFLAWSYVLKIFKAFYIAYLKCCKIQFHRIKLVIKFNHLNLLIRMGFPGSSAGKELACNAGDLGSIPGLGRPPGEGNGYLLQYSGLENSMDCIVHGVTKSWRWLSDFHFYFFINKNTYKN